MIGIAHRRFSPFFLALFILVSGVAECFAAGQKPAREGEAEQKNPKHQISVGAGLPLYAVTNSIYLNGAGFIVDDLFFMNIPLEYRYRPNERVAFGAGLTLNIIYLSSQMNLVGGEITGGIDVYALPDWLSFGLDFMLGFPFLFALAPSMGHGFSITDSFKIFIKNEIVLMFLGGVIAFWQPILGVEYRF